MVYYSEGAAADAFAAGQHDDPLWTCDLQLGEDAPVTVWVFAPTAAGAQQRAVRQLSTPQRVSRKELQAAVLRRLVELQAERTLNAEGGTGLVESPNA